MYSSSLRLRVENHGFTILSTGLLNGNEPTVSIATFYINLIRPFLLLLALNHNLCFSLKNKIKLLIKSISHCFV